MVAGGLKKYGSLEDSTEVFSTYWTTVPAKLPHPMYNLRVATINNRVLAFGKS